MIEQFSIPYRFLSNFWYASFEIDGCHYRTVEHYFQSMKAKYQEDADYIANLPKPQQAKKEARKITMRDDWPSIKVDVMRKGVRAKFYQNPDLAQQLLSTGDEYLQEGNNWNDTFWGVCNGVGQNMLGIILMEIRNELRQNPYD